MSPHHPHAEKCTISYPLLCTNLIEDTFSHLYPPPKKEKKNSPRNNFFISFHKLIPFLRLYFPFFPRSFPSPDPVIDQADSSSDIRQLAFRHLRSEQGSYCTPCFTITSLFFVYEHQARLWGCPSVDLLIHCESRVSKVFGGKNSLLGKKGHKAFRRAAGNEPHAPSSRRRRKKKKNE